MMRENHPTKAAILLERGPPLLYRNCDYLYCRSVGFVLYATNTMKHLVEEKAAAIRPHSTPHRIKDCTSLGV